MMSSETKSGNSSKASGEYWDRVSEKLENYYADSPYFKYKKEELSSLVNNWGGEKLNGKILTTDLYEEAMGCGGILWDIACRNPQTYGIDIAPDIVAKTEKKAKERGVAANLSVQDVRKLDFPDNFFDLVISNSTLDHFPEVAIALKEISRVLKDQGVLILTLHNKKNPLLYLFLLLSKLASWQYKFYSDGAYSIKETDNLLREAGLTTTNSTTILHIPPLLPTLTNSLCKTNNVFLKKTGQAIVNFFKYIGRKNTSINNFTGYLIALKAVKK